MSVTTSNRQADPVRIVPNTRPLQFHEGRLFCARFDRILSTSDYGKTFTDEGRIEAPVPLYPIIRATPLLQRIARLSVYRMRVLPDNRRVYLFRGGVYVQAPGEPLARRTWTVTEGSRPVSLAVGADGLVVFGEYWLNPKLEQVRILGSRDGGETWTPLVTFAPGEVRHVHGIMYDRWEECFWICTGDDGDQNRLIRASADFSQLRSLRQGGQENRFYSVLVTENTLIAATDSPVDENHICIIDKKTGEATKVARIENSNFFSCILDGMVFVSTNAETSAINDIAACHVWTGSPSGGSWRRVLSFPVDKYTKLGRLPGLPFNLFQYPQVFLAEGDNPGGVLVGQGIGLRGLDGAMFCYDTRAWSPRG